MKYLFRAFVSFSSALLKNERFFSEDISSMFSERPVTTRYTGNPSKSREPIIESSNTDSFVFETLIVSFPDTTNAFPPIEVVEFTDVVV